MSCSYEIPKFVGPCCEQIPSFSMVKSISFNAAKYTREEVMNLISGQNFSAKQEAIDNGDIEINYA